MNETPEQQPDEQQDGGEQQEPITPDAAPDSGEGDGGNAGE